MLGFVSMAAGELATLFVVVFAWQIASAIQAHAQQLHGGIPIKQSG